MTQTYVRFFWQMPYEETNTMTPPPVAETRELQEMNVSERKEEQELTKNPEVIHFSAAIPGVDPGEPPGICTKTIADLHVAVI